MKILYLSYDGLLESLGYSQVFQYLRELAKAHQICLITFEKSEDWDNIERRNTLREEVARAGIRWFALRYHKRPTLLATAYDISVGFLLGCFLVLRHRVEIVHARSYTPSVIALGFKGLLGVKYVFDMRGFWPDEKVDGGVWARASLLYRLAKKCEERFLMGADRVVSLTRKAVEEMKSFSYLQGRLPAFEVITTCTDLGNFRPRPVRRIESDSTAGFTLGSVGAVKLWYLFDQVLECFAGLRELIPSARLLIINQGEHDYIRERLSFHGVPENCVTLRAVSFANMPVEMSEMDAAILLVKPSYSSMAKAPTKLGELLGCGVPCLGSEGMADMCPVLERDRVGVVIKSFGAEEIRRAIGALVELASDPDISRRCRHVAEEYFSLASGVEKYDRIYRELGGEVAR